jgi:dihydroorotate dehydrogenase
MGSALLENPRAHLEVITGLREYLKALGLSSVRDLVGGLQLREEPAP